MTPTFEIARAPIEAAEFARACRSTPSITHLPAGWIVLALVWAMVTAAVVIAERIAAA